MKTMVVLGMHRSGTSLVAEGVGHIVEMHPGCAEYENMAFVGLNERILRAAGGGWNRPPSHEAILAQAGTFGHQIKTLIERESARAVDTKNGKWWGWKDPRTTLTIDLYTPYLENPHYVACFRDPDDVVKNIMRVGPRGPYEPEYLRELIQTYNSRLLDFLTRAYRQPAPAPLA